MGKKSNFGKVTKPIREKPRKRPGRHSKKPNKKQTIQIKHNKINS